MIPEILAVLAMTPFGLILLAGRAIYKRQRALRAAAKAEPQGKLSDDQIEDILQKDPERLLSDADVAESFESARASDRTVSFTRE